MRKILNIFGVLFSIILTIVLTAIVSGYAILMNVRSYVSQKGINKVLNSIDTVQMVKDANSGKLWNDIVEHGKEINLSESQITEMLNSKTIKSEISYYINKVLVTITDNKKLTLTEKELRNLVNTAIDEYNNVSSKKITDSERKEILNSINDEVINSINDELSEVKLDIDHDDIGHVNKALFGNYHIYILIIIVTLILLIALLRFSYYKWMPYTAVSCILAASLLLTGNVFLAAFKFDEAANAISPFRNYIVSSIYTTSFIIYGIAIVLFVLYHIVKKNHAKDNDLNEQLSAM